MSPFLFLIGLCVGSFIGVLADRLPRGESVLWGRSHCDYCKKTLRWYELIPLFSYVVQGGRCRRCHKRLSVRYPLIELVTGAGFVFLFFTYGSSVWMFVSLAILFSSLLVLWLSDMKYQILPDSMILAGTVGVLGYLYTTHVPTSSWGPHILSAALGYVFFWALWRLTRGRGMGLGDAKFAVLMGLFLGHPLTIVALYIAFLTGAAAGVILMIGKKVRWKSAIAFGPFLILGTVVAFVWGPEFIALWNNFF